MTGGGHEKVTLSAEEQAERRLEELLSIPLFKREKEVPPEAFLWMALAPGWTLSIAEACHFPSLRLDVKGTFKRLCALGVAHATRVLLSNGDPADLYQMEDEGRTEILNELLADQKEWRSLRSQLAKIGRLLAAMSDSAPEMLPETRRWAQLAQYAEEPSRLADELSGKVKSALSAGDTAEALRWMETARPLADLLASCLEMTPRLALERTARWLDLHRQRRHDEQLIRFYLSRPEQEEALNGLRKDQGPAWALHFLGTGGVGKTTFIRHLAVELAKKPDEVVVARVDFDYLNPDYPRLAPGLLLSHFAAELCSYDRTGRATECARQADDILRELYGKLRFTGTRAAGRSTDRPEFRVALGHYLDAFRELGRPILLIVDTCEELLKFHPEDGVLESLEETFRVLRALHDGPDTLSDPDTPPSGGLSDLRVIFAGRRLLASAGYQWHSKPAGDDAHLRLPPRPYLRLHEVRGFSHEEAETYLRDTLEVPENLVAVIIEKSSPDIKDTAPVVYDQVTARPDPKDRCHPMELRLFADWAKDPSPPSVEVLREAKSIQYVERRILERLPHDPLRQLMPVLALMGHFHAGIIREIATALGLAFEPLYEDLLGQEWTDQMVQSIDGGARSRLGLIIEPGLLRRLRAYYDEQRIDPNLLGSAAAALERTTLHDPLESLDWLTFDAALRVLEREPRRAAAWWQQVEAHLLAERDFTWIAEWTQAWVGPDGAAAMRGPRESPVRPAALAFHAAALLHCNPRADLAALWREVEAKADASPIPELRAPLRLRAVAGLVAGARHLEADPDPPHVARLWQEVEALGSQRRGLQQIASLVAAVEALVERAEWPPDREWSRAFLGLPAPDGADTLELRARCLWDAVDASVETKGKQQLGYFIASLAARMHLLAGRVDLAREWFARSLECPPTAAEDSPPTWVDWIPPDDVAARVRLEFVRACCPALLSPQEALAAVGDWSGRTDTVDGDRLRSALLRLRLASGTVTSGIPSLPEWLTAAGGTAPTPAQLVPGESACLAHREVPPLFTTYAEVLAAGGRVAAALTTLRRVLLQVGSFPFEARLWAERTLLRIAARLRLGEEGVGGGEGLAQSPDLADRTLLWTVQALSSRSDDALDTAAFSEAAASPESAAWLNALWQTLCIRLSPAPQAVIREAQKCFPSERPGSGFWRRVSAFDRESLRLDAWEAHLAEEGGAAASAPVVQALVRPDRYWEQHPRQPEEALRLWLRVRATGGESGDPSLSLHLLTRLGRRRGAEIALEEADLLSLRLPRAAVPLYDLAADWFPEADAGRLVSMVAAMIAIGYDDQQALGARLSATAAAYDALRASPGGAFAALPAWPELEALADSPVPGPWEALGPTEWRPWLVRLLLCLTHRPGARPQAPDAFHTVAAWTAGRYPRTSEGTATCPPDLVPWVRGRVQAPPRQAPRGPLPRHVWRSVAITLGVGALAAAGILLGIGLGIRLGDQTGRRWYMLLWFLGTLGLTVAFMRSRRPSRWALLPPVLFFVFGNTLFVHYVVWGYQGTRTVPGTASALVAGGTVCYFLWNVALSIRASWAGLSTLELRVSPAATPGAPGVPGIRLRLAQWRRGLVWQWPLWARRRRQLLEQDSPLPKPLAYFDLASLLPGAAQDLVRRLRAKLGSRPAEVVIDTAPGLHGLAWEAAFAPPATRHPLHPASLPFRFRRVTTGRPPRRQAVADNVQVAFWATHPVAAQVATQGWRSISRREHFAFASLPGNDLEALAPSLAGAQVLHLIGTVEEVSQGLRFRSMEAAAYRPGGRHAFAPVHLAAAEAESTAVRLLRAEDVARLLPDLSLCLLQGPPGRFVTSRLDSDRRAASLARSFAAELFTQGVPAVLVIPPLETRLAARAVGHLSQALRARPRRGTRALLEVTARLRRAVAEEAARALRASLGTPRYLLVRLLDSSGLSALFDGGQAARARAKAHAPTWEAMLDICLYAVPDWDGRIAQERSQVAGTPAHEAPLPT